MKNLLCIVLIVITGCQDNRPTFKQEEPYFEVEGVGGLRLIEIKNCEYLLGKWGYATVLTHKGDCKFCIERNKCNQLK